MKISKFSLLIFIFSMIYSNSYGALIYPMAKITIKALDNDGAPIPIADVTFNFDYAKDPGMGWGTKTETVEGKTDNYGMFTITKPAAGKCSFRVNKDGFYDSSKSYEFKETTALFTWSPWNPTVEINLKKIINPTTMYAKNTAAMKVPALESPVGYDLVKGDWVAPYGKGTVSDFIFQFNR